MAQTSAQAQQTQEPTLAQCRICHSNGLPRTEDAPEVPAEHRLVSPCLCSGTCQFAHARCIEEWIARRLKSGTPAKVAATCELCTATYAHTLHAPHALAFLFGPRSWRRWAHLAYMAFVGRRMCHEMRVVGRIAGGAGGPRGAKVRGVASRAAFSLLMATHYAVFLMLDARLLVAAFRRWRARESRIVVLDRGRRGVAPGVEEGGDGHDEEGGGSALV